MADRKNNGGMRTHLSFACLISLLATTFFFANYDIVERYSIKPKQQVHDHRKQRRRDNATTSSSVSRRRKDVEALNDKLSTDVKRKSKRKQSKQAKANHYHNNAVFITHYHKTGYVLSRELMFLLHEIESTINAPDVKHEKRGSKFEVSGVDDSGNRFAFDGVGNWARSAFTPRKHLRKTNCPNPAKGRVMVLPERKGFTLRDSTIYIQESPDLFCSDEDILKGLTRSHPGGTKIIHFVRNPYEMVLSNYFYHSQEPTPEKWVHKDLPCETLYADGDSVASHIIPILAQELNKSNSYITERFNGIDSMCNSLFQSTKHLQNSTFYEHLLQLDKYDGLRLATAQMIAASGESNGHYAGGDVLRMANNLIRFKRLQQASTPDNKIEVYTVTMGDFIKNMSNGTYDFLNFIIGEDDDTIPKSKLWKAALQQEEKYAKKLDKSPAHVTQTNEEDMRAKSMLKERLRGDDDLSFILNATEVLVNEALGLAA